jgi:hypothetical protein
MTPSKCQIEEFLEGLGVEFELHTLSESENIAKRWLLTYAQQVKKATGAWIYNGFKWHGFSFEHQTAIEGKDALRAYQSQWPAPYVVFDEEGIWSYGCTSERYPDFTCFGAEVYVAHHNMKWTMAFTHEQPHIGPFFAMKQGTSGVQFP